MSTHPSAWTGALPDAPAAWRIERYAHTPEEIDAALDALPLYRAARNAAGKGTRGGKYPAYTGPTAWDLIEERVSDRERALLTMSLVVAMARGEG